MFAVGWEPAQLYNIVNHRCQAMQDSAALMCQVMKDVAALDFKLCMKLQHYVHFIQDMAALF